MSSLKPKIDPEKLRINGLVFGETYGPDYTWLSQFSINDNDVA